MTIGRYAGHPVDSRCHGLYRNWEWPCLESELLARPHHKGTRSIMSSSWQKPGLKRAMLASLYCVPAVNFVQEISSRSVSSLFKASTILTCAEKNAYDRSVYSSSTVEPFNTYAVVDTGWISNIHWPQSSARVPAILAGLCPSRRVMTFVKTTVHVIIFAQTNACTRAYASQIDGYSPAVQVHRSSLNDSASSWHFSRLA